jgi:hypothetical protein
VQTLTTEQAKKINDLCVLAKLARGNSTEDPITHILTRQQDESFHLEIGRISVRSGYATQNARDWNPLFSGSGKTIDLAISNVRGFVVKDASDRIESYTNTTIGTLNNLVLWLASARENGLVIEASREKLVRAIRTFVEQLDLDLTDKAPTKAKRQRS